MMEKKVVYRIVPLRIMIERLYILEKCMLRAGNSRK